MTKILSFMSCALLIFSLAALKAIAARMKLLTPETGWALMGPGLMWTTDGGANWTNITPPVPKGEHISSVFFLDTQDGWVLLSGPATGSESPRLDLAITVDGGGTWSVMPFEAPGIELAHCNLSGGGHIFFLDTLNGWANLEIPGMLRPALLLETHDGARTWGRSPSNPNVAGQLRFINSKVGWLKGGPSGDDLYTTRNGGESWQEVPLSARVNGAPATCGISGLPQFTDEAHGHLPATCMGGAVVLFATNDGGKTWKQQRVLTGVYWEAGNVATTITGATLIAGVMNDRKLTLIRDTPQGMSKASCDIAISHSGVNDLSFADTVHGWALLWHHHALARLYSTSDGGNAWADITPQIPRKELPRAPTGSGMLRTRPRTGFPIPWPISDRSSSYSSSGTQGQGTTLEAPESQAAVTPDAPAAGGRANFHTSLHIGFDSCFGTQVTQQQFLTDMQAWH